MKLQKRLAAQVIGCSPKRIIFDEARLDEIKEAITKSDIRNMINAGAIIALQKTGVSRSRAGKRARQRKKGRRRGHGSRKGSAGARDNRKRAWVNRVRMQRDFISELKKNKRISKMLYNELYSKIKGGFFRSKGHISVYLEERGILKQGLKQNEK